MVLGPHKRTKSGNSNVTIYHGKFNFPSGPGLSWKHRRTKLQNTFQVFQWSRKHKINHRTRQQNLELWAQERGYMNVGIGSIKNDAKEKVQNRKRGENPGTKTPAQNTQGNGKTILSQQVGMHKEHFSADNKLTQNAKLQQLSSFPFFSPEVNRQKEVWL